MDDVTRDGEPRQSSRFLVLYALAAAGGSASYAPFLTLILPGRISELAGDDAVRLLSYTAFVGAIAASGANIAFGWLSDRTGNRRGWIVAGLLLSGTLLVAMQSVDSAPALLALIFLWQSSLNMMLGPLAAWAGDSVPDSQKGTLGGLLSLAPGGGALIGALVTLPGLAEGTGRLVLIAALVAAMILPALLFGKPRPMPHLMVAKPSEREIKPTGAVSRRLQGVSMPVWRMWLARLLVQIAEATLFAFLFVWLRGIDRSVTDNRTATIFTVVLFGAVPLAIAAGRWSDRSGRPMLPLVAATACSALGLAIMATSGDATAGIAGYATFGIAAAVFLALHTSQTLRVLPHPRHRGRDLGIFNLTNTVPSLIMPGLTLALVPTFGFRPLFVLLALLVGLAGVLLAPLRSR